VAGRDQRGAAELRKLHAEAQDLRRANEILEPAGGRTHPNLADGAGAGDRPLQGL
jgi:hypothetical protein